MSGVVVAGSLAQRPGAAGHTWVFLQWLLGLRRLGLDPLFVDWLSPDMCEGRMEASSNVRYLAEVMDRFGLGDAYSLLDRTTGEALAGRSRAEVLRAARDADLLLNVMGYLDDEEILAAAPLRVFLDIDPGFGQMWRELGLADVFAGHDRFVTVGGNVGLPGCGVPACGLDWIRIAPPVVLEHWPACAGNGRSFTSVCTWRGAFEPVEYRGERYGLRVHEFRGFAELPRRVGASFEIALQIDDADAGDRALLVRKGWRLVDPRSVASDPLSYRTYIASSTAELAVAKQMYVSTRSGWFSDRSACYLASGKPALVQDTGLGARYPLGEGLIAFSTIDEATAGVEEILGRYERHARAARAVAEECFESDRVLGRLLDELGAR